MRTRPGWVESEIYFRFVHASQYGHNVAPATAYHKQTVEIALGPKGAFEGGNIGALTRRVVELLRKAIEWQALLDSGKIANQADFARREGVTRARVTQVMGMLRLDPEIKEHILSMPNAVRRPQISERMLRPIEMVTNHYYQIREFHKLLG